MLHKIRESMAAEFKGRMIGGEGKTAEIDGAYFGGYVRPANLGESRKDRHVAICQASDQSSILILGFGGARRQDDRNGWQVCRSRQRVELSACTCQIR
jgi:hypothetical protein